jgi:hypothetical protein
VGPLILIFIGCVFFLQNTGYLPPNFWQNLWRLWPAVLVLAGLELLLGHRVSWLALAGVSGAVLVLGAIATNSTVSPPPTLGGQTVTRTDRRELSGATQAAVTIRLDAVQLNVASLEETSTAEQLALMTYDGPPELTPQARYSVSGGTGRLEYVAEERGGQHGFFPFGGHTATPRLNVDLSPSVPITSLNIKSGASETRLDLSRLRVADLDIAIGAAATWIRLPDAGKTSARINSGAATVTLEVPPAVGAQIRYRGGLSTINIDQTRFPRVEEGLYRSPDFETNPNQVDINLQTGVTTIQVS